MYDKIYMDKRNKINVIIDKFLNGKDTYLIKLNGSYKSGKSVFIDSIYDTVSLNSDVIAVKGKGDKTYSKGKVLQVIDDAFSNMDNYSKIIKVGNFKKWSMKLAPSAVSLIPIFGEMLSSILKEENFKYSNISEISFQFCKMVKEVFYKDNKRFFIMLDDFHWADKSSCDLIATLLRYCDDNQIPLAVFLTYNKDEGDMIDDHSIEELSRSIGFNVKQYEFELGDLSYDEVSYICQDILGFELKKEEAQVIMKEFRSNIYNISSFCKFLKENAEKDFNENIKQYLKDCSNTFTSDLKKLSDAEFRILEIATVCGIQFEGEKIIELSDMEETDTRSILRKLCKNYNLIVSTKDGYKFINENIYKKINQSAKKDSFDYKYLQKRFSDIIMKNSEKDKLNAAVLLIDTGERKKALNLLFEVIKNYSEKGFSSEALRLFAFFKEEDILSFKDCWPYYLKSLYENSEFESIVNFVGKIEQDNSLELTDPIQFISSGVSEKIYESLLVYSIKAHRMENDWKYCIKAFDATVNHVGEHCKAELYSIRGEVFLCSYDQDFEKSRASFEKSIEFSSDDKILEYRACGHIGLIELCKNNYSAAIKEVEKAQRLAEETDNPFDIYESIHWMSKIYIAMRDVEKGLECINKLEKLSDRYGISAVNPYHIRDKSRLFCLKADIDKSSDFMLEYISRACVNYKLIFLNIIFQMLEVKMINKSSYAKKFIEILIAKIQYYRQDEDKKFVLKNLYDMLLKVDCDKITDDESARESLEKLGIELHYIESVESVFTFNKADFWKF